MNWYLVLLFWNPAIQDFDVADGFWPLPFASETICEMRLDYVEMYLPSYTADIEHVVDCIQANDMYEAIRKAQE